jgi:hypothetical protein
MSWLFSRFWKNRLLNDFWSELYKKPIYDKVVHVTGWRSAYIDTYGGARKHVKFCLKFFGYYF